MASDEINVSSNRGISFVVSEAAKQIESRGRVTLCGINFAMPRLVQAVELLKHSIKGLHQQNHFERVADTNKTRLHITLSLNELDTRSNGYQVPIAGSKVQERPISEIAKLPERRQRPERPDRTEDNLEESKDFQPRQQRGGRRARGERGRRRYGRDAWQGPPGLSGRYPRGQPRNEGGFSQRGSVGQDKYYRVPKRQEEGQLQEDELRITSKIPTDIAVKRAVVLFKRRNLDSITLKAIGSAISHAITISEAVRRGVAGLHQITNLSRVEVTDIYMPKEEGLAEIEKNRVIQSLEITLSRTPGDKTHYGYQAPLALDKVREISIEDAERGQSMVR
mmetsp:Transcript_24829/g.43704  ORF Transcript_24829/g.43704 Transcript_24829/m.43704 type:complete len:336 (-) Transcript_24829:22-1029(-)